MTLPTRPIHKTPRWAPVLECLAMVGIGAFLNLQMYPDNPGFVDVQPHPALFVVLVIGLRYGFRASVMAVILTSLAYGLLLLQLAEVPTYLYLLEPPYSTPAVILVPLGVVVGLLSQKHLDRVAEVVASNEALYRENRSLRGEHEQLRDVNLELAGRVVGAEGTVGQLYEFAKQLNVADEQKIFEGLLHLLAQALGAEKSTIWRVRDTHLEFLACSQNVPPESQYPPDCARYEHLFDDGGVLALHDLPEHQRAPHLPFLLGKLTDGQNGALVAYVAVETMPFARYNEETIRLFRMIVDWASTSLGNVNAAPSEPMEIRHIEPVPVPMHTIQGFAAEDTIEGSLQRLGAIRQAAVPPSSPPSRQRAIPSTVKPRFPEAREVATVIDEMRWDTPAPAGAKPPSGNAFVPSVSVILLNEAGAPDPGNLTSVPTVMREPERSPRGPGHEAPTVVYEGDKQTVAVDPRDQRPPDDSGNGR